MSLIDQPTPQTFLVVGLGNPGRQYRHNRHNIGFMLVDRLAARLGIAFTRLRHQALVTDGHHEGHKVILAKPQTFMNLSGQAVGALVRFFKIPLENLLVAYDDVDLPLETLRLRPSGGSAGQKGMKSIIDHLGTQEFPRLRLGIDRPPGRMSTPAYVLQNFSEADSEMLSIFLDRGADAVLAFFNEGIDAAMSKFNQAHQKL